MPVGGAKRKHRSPGVGRALLPRSHRVDPRSALTYNRFNSLRRALLRRPHIGDVFEMVWHLRERRSLTEGDSTRESRYVPGRVGLLQKEIKAIGWIWATPWAIPRPGRPDLPVCGGPMGRPEHAVREEIKLKLYREAVATRLEFAGIEQGIDEQAIMCLLRKGKKSPFDAYDTGTLEGILVGTQRHQGHWQRAGFDSTGDCTWCPIHTTPSKDGRCHWIWRCQHPEAVAIRQQYFQAASVDTSN